LKFPRFLTVQLDVSGNEIISFCSFQVFTRIISSERGAKAIRIAIPDTSHQSVVPGVQNRTLGFWCMIALSSVRAECSVCFCVFVLHLATIASGMPN